jgi:cell wall-associated NlpC family hydrolase
LRLPVAFAFFASSVLACAGSAFAGQLTHTVVSGDSLWTIAQHCHVSVASLEHRNHLTDASVLQLGQTIVVGDAPKAQIHTARVARTHVASRRVVAVTHSHAQSRAHSRPPSHPIMVAQSTATKNAVWVATHSGQAPAPPALQSISLAQKILAFDAKVTHTALRYVGVPYVWGGTSFNGVDCSGFVQAVFEHNGIELPRTADSQYEAGRPVKMSDLQPGDVVFFETYTAGASHVGIYLGNGRFVHASSSNGVRVDVLSEDYYASRYLGARRFIR